MTSHYDRLGVSPSATADELHRAYRSQANRLHPDKHAARSTREQADAEREMQRLNEAWHVLSDPGRRRQYDDALASPMAAPAPPAPSRSDDVDGPIGPHDPAMGRLLRVILLAVGALVLITIFVFAAAALSGRNEEGDGTATSAASVAAGDCILVERGQVSAIVPCEGPHDARVARRIPRADACPSGEERVDGPDGSSALCVVPNESGP